MSDTLALFLYISQDVAQCAISYSGSRIKREKQSVILAPEKLFYENTGNICGYGFSLRFDSKGKI